MGNFTGGQFYEIQDQVNEENRKMIEEIKNKTKAWGHWTYNPKYNTLHYGDGIYEVDLDKVKDEKQLGHIIMHLIGKNWNIKEVLGDFINALKDLHYVGYNCIHRE